MAVGAHGPRDVLERLLAAVLEGQLELAPQLLEHAIRDAEPAGRRQRLEACGDVHAVPEEPVAVDRHLAQVDADA